MNWQHNERRNIWVIGSSSGIGLALVEQLLLEGHSVIASSRSHAALTRFYAVYPDRFRFVKCDVTDVVSVTSSVQSLKNSVKHIDTLIFNAGVCEYIDNGALESIVIERVFETNVFGFSKVIEQALPLLRPKQGAQIAAVSSSAAYLPLPRAEAYGASKAALTYLTHTLGLTLCKQGIYCSVISPGFVKTPLTDKNDFNMPMMVTDVEAATAIIAGLSRYKKDIHFPKRFTYLLKLLAHLPVSLQHKLTQSLART